MFEVVKPWSNSGVTTKVYAVGQDSDGDPLFLIYNSSLKEWVWEPTTMYTPAEDKTQYTPIPFKASRPNPKDFENVENRCANCNYPIPKDEALCGYCKMPPEVKPQYDPCKGCAFSGSPCMLDRNCINGSEYFPRRVEPAEAQRVHTPAEDCTQDTPIDYTPNFSCTLRDRKE